MSVHSSLRNRRFSGKSGKNTGGKGRGVKCHPVGKEPKPRPTTAIEVSSLPDHRY